MYMYMYMYVPRLINAYLKESKEEFNEFGGQSLIILTNGELVQATDGIVPTMYMYIYVHV